jgi:uncharacterized membrane protein
MPDRKIPDTALTDQPKAIVSIWKRLSGAEIYLVLVILIFGISTCFLLPVGAGYDEETHLMRVWEMSGLTFIPNDQLGKGMPFPAVYWEMSYRRSFIVRPVETEFLEQYQGLPVDAHDYIYGSAETRSVYAPPLLLPQALVMRYFGRSERWSALTTFYACRIVSLLSFLTLAWLAVHLIPFGKWTLAILASSPVVVLQASTVSADAISNGIAFLFIGASLALVHRKELYWREWIAFVFLFLILFWGKLNIVPLAVLPFLLLKPSNFKMRYGYVLLVLVAVVLLLAEVAGWNLVAYSRLHTAPTGTDPIGQIRFLLDKPLEFLGILASQIWTKAADYFRDWIAIYGYNYWPVPRYTYYIYAAALLISLFQATDEENISRGIRIGLIVVFVIAYLATILSLYLTFTPVGSHQVEGVQGRYFVTVMPLLFLALCGLPLFKKIRIPVVVSMILGISSLAIFIAGMYLSYHVLCGSQYYQPGLCYQPNYKNWAPDQLYSPPVSDQMTLSQEIVPECNGMTELRIWVNAAKADRAETTNFVLKDVQNDREEVHVSVPNADLPAGAWYTLAFPADWTSSGKFYLLTVSGDNPGGGPQIAYSLKQEYPAGKLYENGQPISKDLIFQTGCVAGWDKLRAAKSP